MRNLVGCKQEGSQWRKEDRSGLINIQGTSVGTLACIYADSQVSVMHSHVMLGQIWLFVSLVLFSFYFAEKALWCLFRNPLTHRSLQSSPDSCSVCVIEMHVFTVMICGFASFQIPSQPTSPQTFLFILLFPFFSPPRTQLLSSSFPRPPPSQHARGGFRRRKAIYDHQPMARFNPFASCTQMRASEIKRDKQKQGDWEKGSLGVIFTLSLDWVRALLLCVNSATAGIQTTRLVFATLLSQAICKSLRSSI